MTLRTRITLWHTAILIVSLAVMATVFRYEMLEDRQTLLQGQPLASLWEETGEFVLYFGLPTAVLLLAGGAWLIHRSLAPVAQLTQAIEQLHLHRLGQLLPKPRRRDELGRLTNVFNAMTTRLDESFEKVREFTLHASHELKTPLTVIRGELETALRDEACPEPQRELLAGLIEEVQRLAKIVDGLSLLAKADAGRAQLELQPLAFDELVRDSFADAQVLAQGASLSVSLDHCDSVTVRGDPHRLRQLLLNLTDNAIKYNRPGGSVTFTLARHASRLELRISNSGPGIPNDQLPQVFDRFFRGDPAHGSGDEGCGLGLTIAQWIVKAHGGEIRIASEPGRTTTVTVFLPLK